MRFFNSIKLKATNKNFMQDNTKMIKTMYSRSLKLLEKGLLK